MKKSFRIAFLLALITICFFTQSILAQKYSYKHFDGKSEQTQIRIDGLETYKTEIYSTLDLKYYGDSIEGIVATPKNENRYIVNRVKGFIKDQMMYLSGETISFEGEILGNGDITGKFFGFWLDSYTPFIFKETYSPNSMAFKHIYINADTILGNRIAEYHNEYDILLPINNDKKKEYDTITKHLIEKIFSYNASKEMDSKSLANMVRDDKIDFCITTNELIADSSFGISNGVSDDYNLMEIMLNEKGLISTINTVYTFHGGAHGLTHKACHVFDLKTGNPIKLDDIFTDLESLNQLLTRKAHVDFKLPETVSLQEFGCIGADSIYATDNFYITREGIGFIYNEYEIACYAGGSFDIMIPIIDLLNYKLIKPDSIVMRIAK